MLGGIFTTFKKDKGLTNFLPFKNSIESIYAVFNKIFGGTTYVDLSTTQTVTTPLISNGFIDVSPYAPISSSGQILNGVASDDLPEISEIDLRRFDSSIPGITPGSLAFGGLSGSASITNYITNSSAETGISGWNLYSNGAFSIPVSGAGGVPVGISFGGNSTNPIKGNVDFQLDYIGTSSIGQGVSTNISINPNSVNKGFKIKFLYRTSANFNTDNLRIFLLDITNNSSLDLSNNILSKSISTKEFEAHFQHQGSQTLRLCFHVKSTNALNWSLFFDEVTIEEIEESATLYYYTNVTSGSSTVQAYQPIKLGWPKGDGIYNNNSTFAQKYSGWCHGTGNYKIITSSQFVDIVFDHILVKNIFNGALDSVFGQLTDPVSYFNIRIIAGSAGLNSVDSGVLSSDTGYYVYFIFNPSSLQYGGILSTSRISPVLPNGFTFYQRLGWIRSANSSGFYPSLQINDKFLFLQEPPIQTAFTTSSSGLSSSASISIISSTVENPANHPHRSLITSVDLKCKSVFNTTSSSYRQIAPINTIYFTNSYNFIPYSAIDAGSVTDDNGDMWNDVSLSQGLVPNYGLSLLVSNGAAVQTTFNIFVTGFNFRNITL